MSTTTSVQIELAEFRREALTVMLALFSLGWIIALVAELIYSRAALAPWHPVALAVMLVALVGANRLRHRDRTTLASTMVIAGLLVAPGVVLAQYGPSTVAAVLLVVPVIAASVLIGRGVEFAVALVASTLVLAVTTGSNDGPPVLRMLKAFAESWAFDLIYWIAALISHLHARRIETLVGWSIDSQQKDARRAELFYQQSEQLKQALLALEHAHARLQIANAELAEARQIADAANRHKTRFLANVSHELRTPLGIIIGSSEAWLQQRTRMLPEDLQRDLRHIHQSGVHLQRLINDLLDCSRLEIGALELFPETIDTRTFVAEVFYSLADHVAPGSPVQWRLQLPDRLPCLNADPVRLRQILLNLLQNAAHHTQHGTITLGAEVCPPHVHLWVEDTGCGIPFDMQQRIFEPFVTVGDQAQRRSGIGLGLSIARQLVQLHHGLLTLESQPGRGTMVHLYLPLPSLSGLVATPAEGANPALLLIAHGPLTPEIEEISRRQRLPLRRIRSGEDPTALLQEVHPVGVVWQLTEAFDADWPLIQQIRHHPQLCQLPLILYSQPGHTPDLSHGITDVRLKPISSAAFVQSTQALRPPAGGPILVVDDDPQARDFYCRLLRETSPDDEVIPAGSGREALAWLGQVTPSLVILDLLMPEIDGFAVLEQLRANPATRRTPVLVLSGRMLSFADVERMNAGNVTVQVKDVWREAELASQLCRLLDGTARPSPPASALVKRGLAFIQQHYAQITSRQEIADAIGVSERYLSQLFTAELGLSPWEYLMRYRIRQARQLLLTSDLPIASIASQVGFDDPAYFSRIFRKEVGCTPRAYRMGMARPQAAPASA
jgi:signal transduction histidine kinase/AraC-like DNA-binding protein